MTSGLFLAILLSSLIHAAWNIAAKRVSGNLSVLWLAQMTAALLIAPVAIYLSLDTDFTCPVVKFLALTGLVQALYFYLLSHAYRIGDISVVYPIARGLGVAGTATVAASFLGERFSSMGLTGILTIGAGTISLGIGRWRGADTKPLIFAAMIGVVLSAGATVDKLAVGVLHPIVYIFFMFFLASLVASPLVFAKGAEPVRQALRSYKRTILIVGAGSMGGYLIILFAFRIGSLAYITALRESSVLLGSLWGYLVLRERFTWRRGLGMTLILTGLVLIRLA